jgi:hypothetical protein
MNRDPGVAELVDRFPVVGFGTPIIGQQCS